MVPRILSRRPAWLVPCVLAAVVLSGCVSRPSAPDDLEFRVAGRVNLVAGERAATANYLWRQYAHGVEIDLWGPLGQGRTRVVGSDASLTVFTADGTRLEGVEADTLVRREFGLAAPVGLLSHWILGRPAPEWPTDTVRDASFTQLGWQVVWSQPTEVSGRRVPGKVVATRGDRRLTLLCREWHFGPPTAN